MQLNSVYLYPNSITAFSASGWTNERFRKVYNKNLKIYKSIDNEIDIQLKNGDQKPISIVNTYVVFNLFSEEKGNLALKKDCIVLSNNQGRVKVKLTEIELNDLDIGYYNYSVVMERRSYSGSEYTVTSKQVLYVNDQFDPIGILEIVGDVEGNSRPSFTIKEFAYVNPQALGEPEPIYYVSSIIDARPNVYDPQTLHSFQIYTTDYSGDIVIQGSLSEGGNPHVWSDLNTEQDSSQFIMLDDFSGSIYRNIKGRFNFFRIKHYPTSQSGVATFRVNQTILNSYEVAISNSGSGYTIGDRIVISGADIGGERVTNDLTIIVTGTGAFGRITAFTYSGVSYSGVRTFSINARSENAGTLDKILYR